MVNIKSLLSNKPKTIKIYLDNSYLKKYTSKVLEIIFERGSRAYIILDRTIFHPKGGGQPSDIGIIKYNNSIFEVKKVLNINDVLAHYGKFKTQPFNIGDNVECELNWNFRYKVMKLHTAGHILDYALREVYGRVVDTIDAMHGPPKAYITYNAETPSSGQLKRIEEIANGIVREDRNVKIVYVNRERLEEVVFNAPNLARLPESESYRIVVIEGVNGIPCTGTHLKRTGEISLIKILGVEKVNDGFKLYYDAD